MEFEIVDAYVIKVSAEDKPRGWSFHLYFPSLDMDMRGIMLLKTNSGWLLKMPFLKNYDVEEKKVISYPVISFLDREKTRQLVASIKEQAIEFALGKIANEIEEKEKKFKKPKVSKNQ